MSAAQKFLNKMREGLPAYGRPNVATIWYAKRNGSVFRLAAWCDMRVTWASWFSGTYDAVCFGTDFAYTVFHAEMFRRQNRWHWGTDGARKGDVVFFDWSGTRSIGNIDHVGVVERNLGGGRLQTIEGNTGDALKRRVRSSGVIVGYGRPAWSKAGGSSAGGVREGLDFMLGLEKGDKGEAVRGLQNMLRLCGPKYARLLGNWGPNEDGVDGDFGGDTVKTLYELRRDQGSSVSEKWAGYVGHYAVGQIMSAFVKHQAGVE